MDKIFSGIHPNYKNQLLCECGTVNCGVSSAAGQQRRLIAYWAVDGPWVRRPWWFSCATPGNKLSVGRGEQYLNSPLHVKEIQSSLIESIFWSSWIKASDHWGGCRSREWNDYQCAFVHSSFIHRLSLSAVCLLLSLMSSTVTLHSQWFSQYFV